jgi:phosphoribosylglycinamide formyltransferase-1
VIDARDTETGVTVHDVTAELDAGPPIAQVRLRVEPGDSPESLAARVLEEEHRLIVEVLAAISAPKAGGDPSGSMAAAPPASRSSGPQLRSPVDA